MPLDRRILIAAAAAALAITSSCMVGSDNVGVANRSNNDISVNACVERGGIPLFSNYARDYEIAMMIECRIPRCP